MAAIIEKETGEAVKLVEGGGGIFDIRKNGETIYSKVVRAPFPDEEEVLEVLR